MILDIQKLTKKGNQYIYEIATPDEPSNRIIFQLTPNGKFEVFNYKENDEGLNEVVNLKEFDPNAIGFSEATDYFESLLAKETSNGGNPNGENNAPPIGILEVLQKSAVSVKMFDGRNADLRKGEYTLKSNILTFNIDYNEFKKGERYYVDAIGSNPKILGLFPIGDLESEGGTNQNIDQDDLDDISEGGDPFNQEGKPNPDGKPSPDGEGEGDEDGEGEPNPDGKKGKGKGKGEPNPDGDGDGDGDGEPNPDGKGKPSPDGTPDPERRGGKSRPEDVAGEYEQGTEGEGTIKDPLTAKDIIAKTYGLPDYESLVGLFGGEQELLNDILSMDEMEKSGIFSKLALNYQNSSQFESTMRRIILT
jgi:hypothetical protein